jgi:hypothetical protein
MTNAWIQKVTGQPVAESDETQVVSRLRHVLGEADALENDLPGEEAPPKEMQSGSPADEPITDEEAAAAGLDGAETAPEEVMPPSIESGEGEDIEDDTGPDSPEVEQLVSSWESGSKMDVAAHLLYTPISYVDFVKMIFRIGAPAGVELGRMLDMLSDEEPGEEQAGSDGVGLGEEPVEEPAAPEDDRGSAERILAKVASSRNSRRPVRPAGETSMDHDSV